MNRLASATSPYLLQHKDNPVDWWEWTDAAFAEAKRRDVPVLISVGYAACHWCHVMAHESFEDAAIGEQINANFVAIKVDREERPDVDAVYMSATQAMTGQGGWPMTVFATPDGQPFYCGTYFPKPHFARLLDGVTEAWRTQRAELMAQGEHVVQALAGKPLTGSGVITPGLLATAVSTLERDYDQVYGGLGGAPKFPPHMLLLFLLRHYRRTDSAEALEMAHHTSEAMARGGLYDQVGGGFHRYTVDGHWVVPHFEKMLYDNALLLRVYTELFRLTGDAMARRVAYRTMGFLLEGLGTPEGGFASALDADTDGVEGLTYAWNPQQLSDVLGAEDGKYVADLLGVTEKGNFEHGLSVPTLRMDVEENERWESLRLRLKAARDQRPQPARDDKVVAAWNGLAITALCEFARVFEESIEPAVKAGELLARVHLVDGRLRRVSRDGVVGEPQGVLEDYGCVAEAFLALHQVTADSRWLGLAQGLLDTAIERFAGFYDTADDAQELFMRPADPTDNATPSGLSSLISALITCTALTGETRYREIADEALGTVVPLIEKHPRFAGYAAAAAEAALSGPYEIAIVTDDPNDPLIRTAVKHAPSGAVVVAGRPNQTPLLKDRDTPAAYVCLGFVCERPVTTTVDLTTILTR